MSLRRLTSLLTTWTAGAALVLGGAPAVSDAATRSTSTNWAGYAVTQTGTAFRHVSGTWVQPAVDCTRGGGTYSSVWVGLGGYKATSTALEQIGTEADCTSAGRATYSTWYELVPDTSHGARIAVRAGDRMHASVVVSGTRTTMTIKNLTRGTSFTKTLRAAAVDVSAAEWIVEAPSLCSGSGSGRCATTALAPFATTTFTAARAVSRSGHAGAVGDAAWTAHAIDLTAGGGRRFADARGDGSASGAGAATTGELDATGASFAVTYTGAGGGTVSQSGPAGTGQAPWAAPRR
jgi:hypothetical protein